MDSERIQEGPRDGAAVQMENSRLASWIRRLSCVIDAGVSDEVEKCGDYGQVTVTLAWLEEVLIFSFWFQ